MANTVPSPLVMCDPLQVSAGRVIKAQQAARMAGAQNWLLSELRAAPLVAQGWPESTCRFENAGATYVTACRWRVPLITDSHTTLRCIILASAASAGAGGSVRFASAGTGASSALSVSAGAATWYQTTLSTAISAGDYDDLTMELAAGTGDEVVVLQVLIQPDPLAAPGAALPVALVDGVEPMGIAAQSADYPLSSAMAQRLGAGCSAMLERPRSLYCWSGLGPDIVTYTGGQAAEFLEPYRHISHAWENAGDNSQFTIWFRALEQASATEAWLGRWRADVGAGAAYVWVQPGAGQSPQYLRGTPNSQLVGSRVARQLSASGVNAYASLGEQGSTASITSISAWGR